VIRVVDGGSLTTGSVWSAVGYNNTAHIIVEKGGSVTFGNHMWVGMNVDGVGTIDINGGYVRVAQMTGLGWSGGDGYVNVNSGLLSLHNLHGTNSVKQNSKLDIRFGTVTIDGNKLNRIIDHYIPEGKITAFGGVGILDVVYADGVTTVTAAHPLNQLPSYDSNLPWGDVELSWTLPDPCEAGQPVNVDVYFTDDYDALAQFTDPASIRVVNNENVTSVIVQAQVNTQYYWAVDTYIGSANDPIYGPISQLFAYNVTPTVDVGADVTTWLVDDVRTTNLDATVTDDGAISPYTVQWTVISEPNDPNSPDAVITDPSAEDTSVTLSALGEYVLQLEAFDGDETGSGTLTINVFSDDCEAAKSLPGWTPSTADINLDCVVDQLDLDILTENWLKCNALDCTDPEHVHVE